MPSNEHSPDTLTLEPSAARLHLAVSNPASAPRGDDATGPEAAFGQCTEVACSEGAAVQDGFGTTPEQRQASFWATFGKDVLLSGERVAFTGTGRAKLQELFEPWGIEVDDLRTRDQLEEAYQLWCQLSEDEDRMTLEALYWSTGSRSVRKQVVEVLGYKPPRPENLEELERWSWRTAFREALADLLEELAQKVRPRPPA